MYFQTQDPAKKNKNGPISNNFNDRRTVKSKTEKIPSILNYFALITHGMDGVLYKIKFFKLIMQITFSNGPDPGTFHIFRQNK